MDEEKENANEELERGQDEFLKGLKFNPFVFDIIPDLVVGYGEERRKLLDLVKEGHKLILLTGPTGAGKTTLLKWAEKRLQRPIFFSKPPYSAAEMVEMFNAVFPRPFFLFFLGPRFKTMFDVVKFLKKRGRTILLVDEAHEAGKEVLEWLRVFTDQVPGLTIVMAGLPKLEEALRSKVETFYQRVTEVIRLKCLSEDETKELIRKRLEMAGTSGMGPFSDEVVRKIHEMSGGFPREILRLADAVLKGGFNDQPKPSHFETYLPQLTSMQMEVLHILMEGELSPPEIAERISRSGYKSKTHAVRSVNNVLKQLMDLGLVSRRKEGRSYTYYLLPRARNVLVEA